MSRTQGIPYGTTASERATMARALAFLFFAGGTLVLITIALPHHSNTNEVGLAVPPLLAFVVVGVLLGWAERLSLAILQALLACGAVLIAGCIYYGGDSAAAYPFMFVWVSLYAYYFFTPLAAGAEILVIAASYSLVLAVGAHVPVPTIFWLMGTGTVLVGGVLIGRLTRAMRDQAADAAAVTQMANGLSEVADFATATCEALQRSSRADVVVLLEPLPDGDGLQVSGVAGPPETSIMFNEQTARDALQHCFRTGEVVTIEADEAPSGLHRFDGRCRGLAQPIVRDAVCAGVLALAWSGPRRVIDERVRNAALLFAAEASLAIERAERLSAEKERRALEINDNIVQGLVVAKYSAQRGNIEDAVAAIDETLGRARRLITEQLEQVSRRPGGQILPGDLAREDAASVATGQGARDR